MSKSKHTEADVIGALKQLEAGRKAEDMAREPAQRIAQQRGTNLEPSCGILAWLCCLAGNIQPI
jgi:hypothetical protein